MTYRHEDFIPAHALPPPSPKPAGTPAPHARKRPNITLQMLSALQFAAQRRDGEVPSTVTTCRALVKRGLARWRLIDGGSAAITKNGRLLIRTQYDALKQVLGEVSRG